MDAASEQNGQMQETFQRGRQDTVAGYNWRTPASRKQIRLQRIQGNYQEERRNGNGAAIAQGLCTFQFPYLLFSPQTCLLPSFSLLFLACQTLHASLLGIFWHILPLDLIPICLTNWSPHEKEKGL